MTRISTTLAPIRKPDSISFGELAIAAGLAGKPVAVCFSESTAAETCQMWKYFSRLTGPERVLHVHGQADVRRLTKTFCHWRLVVVHAPRLFNTVAWTVQMHGSGASALPTIFSRSIPSEADDVPIPLLVLRNTPDESSFVVHWLTAGCPQRAILPDGRPENGIELDPTLIPVTVPGHLPNGRGPRKLHDCQLLVALLSGACLVGDTQPSPEPIDSPTCGHHEYDRVRRLLQSPLVNTADEPVDQLAVDMVNRGNVFLELKQNAEFAYANSSLCGFGNPIHRQRGSRTRQELVTRREIADLGNVRCRLIQQMVEFLRSAQDGHNAFLRMGLVRRPPSERGFKGSETRALTMMLRPWSPKKVSRHFDALRKAGLIDGERESGNAPWQYRLPEELTASTSAFQHLPRTEELTQNQ